MWRTSPHNLNIPGITSGVGYKNFPYIQDTSGCTYIYKKISSKIMETFSLCLVTYTTRGARVYLVCADIRNT